MKRYKIGFILPSNSQNPLASTRISVLNMFPFLKEAGIDPHIIYEPKNNTETPEIDDIASQINADGFDLIYFQKTYGESVKELVIKLRFLKIRTVFGVCDLTNIDMVENTDITIVVTNYLKSLYPKELQSKIKVVHDGIEEPDCYKTDYSNQHGSRQHPLHAVLVTSDNLTLLPILGSPPEWLKISIVGPFANRATWKGKLQDIYWTCWTAPELNTTLEQINYLRFRFNPRINLIKWDLLKVYNTMQMADIAIIPAEKEPPYKVGQSPRWKMKSENRLTLKMSMGLPVIASPVPSYKNLIKQGENGFLADSAQQWKDALERLRDPALRKEMGLNARLSVKDYYSKENQANHLITILNALLSSRKT